MFTEFKVRKKLITSTIEFADRFGAGMSKTEKGLGDLNVQHRGAMDAYLEQDWVTTSELLVGLLDGTIEVNELATQELNRALIWVYVINWLVVTATFMFSGFVLWTLMVKRRLYKEISTTSLRGYRIEGW
jgi:hypothetical protein